MFHAIHTLFLLNYFQNFKREHLELRICNLERDALRSMAHGEASDVLQPVSSVDDLKELEEKVNDGTVYNLLVSWMSSKEIW